MVTGRHVSGAAVTAYIVVCVFETSNFTPNDTAPPTRSHLLIFPLNGPLDLEPPTFKYRPMSHFYSNHYRLSEAICMKKFNKALRSNLYNMC